MARWLAIALGVCGITAVQLSGIHAGTGRGGDGVGTWAEDGKASDAPFAVVELFTSEGCSSCPPADALLSDILLEARKNHSRVFVLSFHVDYWDRLGWTDPHGAGAFTQRQQEYARLLKLRGVYTPQTIVNGRDEFVGSDRAQSRASIEAALKRPARALVKLEDKQSAAPDSLALTYEVGRAKRGDVLRIALVQRGIVSAVKRGENAGRSLRHENVVRAFTSVRLDGDGKGRVALKLPQNLIRRDASVIAYLQDPETAVVLGATVLAVPAEAGR